MSHILSLDGIPIAMIEDGPFPLQLKQLAAESGGGHLAGLPTILVGAPRTRYAEHEGSAPEHIRMSTQRYSVYLELAFDVVTTYGPDANKRKPEAGQ